ncbi:MAG: thioredoxin family protein [Myxococcales bacterium]|nr:thioredoxin family protein [Myxococcales bacterium]
MSRDLVLAALVLLAASCTQSNGAPRARPRVILAPAAGEVAALVSAQRARSGAAGRELIVYVGAKWCEPCRRFIGALHAGKLDREFPRLDVLKFDLDRDRARLAAAGYRSRLIPLFARPRRDGRASGRMIQGSVKGTKAVANITPRLQRLLAANMEAGKR